MSRRALHLLAVWVVALGLRLAMVALASGWFGGMTSYLLGLSDMLSSGYGYHRVHMKEWTGYMHAMRARSEELAAVGRQLDEATRLPLPAPLFAEFYRNPGYPIFLHLVYRTFGEPLVRNARLVQAVVASVSPLLAYVLVLLLFGRAGPALATAWLMALHVPLAFIDVVILADGFAALLVLAGVVATALALARQELRWLALAGVLFGCSGYFRSNVLYLWVFVGAALFVGLPRWRRPILGTALMAACLYGALLPWALRNHRESGRWIWGATRTGAALWESAGQFPNPWGMKLDDAAARELAQAQGFESEATPEADEWFLEMMMRYMREDPAFFVVGAIRRTPFMLAPAYPTGYRNPNRTHGMYSHYLNEEGLSPFEVLVRKPGYVVAAFWERLLVMVVGGLGTVSLVWVAWRNRSRRPGAVALMLAVPLYYYAVHAPTHVNPRYLAPLIPFQMMALALAGADVLAWWRARRAGGGAGAVPAR